MTRPTSPLARDALTLLLLFGFTVFLRYGTFPPSVIDWDESLYLLIARSMLEGGVPYVSVWDHKPPGIFVLFALARLLFGPSIAAVRFAACLAVTASAYLLVRFGRNVFGRPRLGGIAGLLYVVFSLQNNGNAANTEIFTAPFVILGVYLFCVATGPPAELKRYSAPALLAAGLAFGMSLQVNYLAVLQLLSILVAALAMSLRMDRTRFRPTLSAAALVMLGASLPFAVPLIYFGAVGHLPEYLYANFTANRIYGSGVGFQLFPLLRALWLLLRNNFLLCCSLLAAPWLTGLRTGQGRERARDLALTSAWLGGAFLGAMITQRFFTHYLLQLLPPLCLLAAYVLDETTSSHSTIEGRRGTPLLVFILLLGVFPATLDPVRMSLRALQRFETPVETDPPRAIASYLNGRIHPDSYLYVVDYQPVLYYLVHARMPTRYAFPLHLTNDHFSKAAGVDPLRELESIFSRRPEYVLMREGNEESAFYDALRGHLETDYEKETVMDGVGIYRRKDSAGSSGP